mmetsp:Transcript_40500/g.41330  ORF Transcript_40500/g.41330 Transcript_40500/m.41330 type:complete len:436 (+) Transcript_40500:143-1450(+)|eukprot:CAMPEP_0182430688 /NCGR_PEP_ID=MMETSP1167-20130531/42563_1 /TAXON_ID=2988 /ORGANISM="Mallomonas Sp, Strain CCMP3275" /LENGTH=435 /DNA_ID=CAMNT_0024616069 /DNA_START=64 /DNA_END=1371 /DNA_ORIENTATION=-
MSMIAGEEGNNELGYRYEEEFFEDVEIEATYQSDESDAYIVSDQPKEESELYYKMSSFVIIVIILICVLSAIPFNTTFKLERDNVDAKNNYEYDKNSALNELPYDDMANDDEIADFWETFHEFKQKYNKVYTNPEEETKRYEIFKHNLHKIDQLNKYEKETNGKAVHGMTKFSDITHEEYKQLITGVRLPGSYREDTKSAPLPSYPQTNSLYSNWIGTYTTPIKDQEKCGSCWAVGSTEQIESDTIRILGSFDGFTSSNTIFSDQQLLDCTYSKIDIHPGCNGGWPYDAFQYVMEKGLEYNYSYPYIGKNESVCYAQPHDYIITLDSYTAIIGNETIMKDHVLTTGPLVMSVNAYQFQFYTGGVMTYCGEDAPVNHAVQGVGINLEDVNNQYWILRNSWNTEWGVDGYMYLEYGENKCNVSSYGGFTTPKKYKHK